MGLLNYIKGTIKENYDLEDIEDIEDIDDFVYDDEQNTGEEQNADNLRTEDLTGLVSEFEKNYQKHEKKAKAPQKKNKKVSSEEKIQEQRRKAKEEEKKYDELLNSVQAKSLIHVVDKMNQAGTQENYSGKLAKEEKEETEYLKQLEKKEEKKRIQEVLNYSEEDKEFDASAVHIPDVSRTPRRLDNINTDYYDKEETKAYIRSQCEIMEEATGHIELAMEEYNVVTETADRVDNLTVDRRIFKSGEHKLSTHTYHRMEQFEDELPRGMKYLEKQESYYETVKRDMRILEGERMSLRMEAAALTTRQLRIRSLALAAIVGLAFVFMVFFIALSVTEDTQNTMLYIVVAFLGAVLALGMFALLKYTERQVLVTEIKLNKATTLLNKTKIKYINAANTLDYEYHKYHVRSSYELSKKYEVYMDMKNEQRKIVQMTTKLSEAEEDLLDLLKKLGLYDAKLWLSQVRALVYSKDMVEVRHDLNTQRQKLRKQIEYNENRIEEAKKNIKEAAVRNPDCMDEAIHIIEQFESKNVRNQ